MKSKKHIAYLVPEYPVVSETFVYREIRVLISLGYQISIYSLRGNPNSADVDQQGLPEALAIYSKSGILHIYAFFIALVSSPKSMFKTLGLLWHDMSVTKGLKAKGKLVFQFLAANFLARQLSEYRVDHLHVHFIHSPAQVAMYASSLCGVPFTVTAHAADIYNHGQLLVEKAQRAKSLVTISDFNKNYFESIGIQPSKILVVRCILDLPESGRSEVESSQSNPSGFVFGSLGRLVRKKGFLTLLRAFKIVLNESKLQPLSLQIAGSGPQRSEIENLINELGLQSAVSLVGALHPSAVSAWMRSLDCFVLACEQDRESGDVDGIPVVLMESMSYGIPSISTTVSGVPELVIDEVTGLLASPADPESLARSMLKLISNNDLKAQLVDGAQKHVLDEFSKESNIARLVSIFEA
ncbi:glycosyltransferase family 4 protein [Ketobacter sp.]